jgi:hypothetical protein
MAQESRCGGPLLGLFDLPLHDGSHFTLTGSGIAEEMVILDQPRPFRYS